jgi:OTU domain-containing protein 6
MSSFNEECPVELCASEERETWAELEMRHKKETRELEGRTRAMLKKATKGEKKKLEVEIEHMMNEMRIKHKDEEDELEEYGEFPVDDDAEEAPGEASLVAKLEKEKEEQLKREQEEIKSKREKAMKKKEKKKKKLEQEEAEKERIRQNAGPSMREEELKILNGALSTDCLRVKEVASDGHCLYRAVADQLKFILVPLGKANEAKDLDFVGLRQLAASTIREAEADFAPFLGIEAGSVEFSEYIRKVESVQDAEWGGQLELRAMATGLRRPIWVYDSSAPVLKMGEEFSCTEEPPIKVVYHRHYLSLGEHYNSVEAIEPDL